jgi:hypothetical protein
MFVTIEPMPSREPVRAAIAVLAPRSYALSAMTDKPLRRGGHHRPPPASGTI